MATLYYWPILARNVGCELVAAEAGITITREEPKWPDFKPQTHFGQLPVLALGELKVSQSLAIVRVLARRGGIAGDTDADFASSEMLIQEGEDIYLLVAKAMYGPGYPASRPAAFVALFAPDGPIARQLSFLEAMVNPADNFTSTGRTAGEAAIMGTLIILTTLEPAESLFGCTPRLRAFYSKREAAAKATLAGLKPYFRRDAGADEE